jgi:glycosyltransferase involved in cell wall biosynthesis
MYQTSASKGQELVAQRMVKYFRKIGNEAFLITSVFHDGKQVISDDLIGIRGYIQVNDAELGIPIIRVASYASNWPPRRIVFKDEIHALERIVNDFQLNVLITHSTLWNGPESVAKFVEWRRNMKALGGYQDPLIFCHMSHYQEPSEHRYSLVERSFRMAWNGLSLKTILRVANLVLVVTPYEEESKVKMGARREDCILFPGGIDDDSFLSFASTDSDELSQRVGFSPGAKIVTYLGTMEERKNPTGVLQVAERVKSRTDIGFVLAGKGDSEYADEVRKIADSMPNVRYLGEVTEKEKIQLIKISYLNILLSRMEALGLTQLEFMFEGVPVITSAIGGQSWIVGDNEEGVHVKGAGDVEGAVVATLQLVDDASKWKRLSVNAKEKANGFTLSKLVKQLDDAITKDIEKESGLVKLPSEVRSTLHEPEVVVGFWSHGTRKVVATSRRVFIQTGRLSRETVETPYSNIRSIEHIRRFSWLPVLVGGLLSLLLFTQHYLFPVISRSLTLTLELAVISLWPSLRIEMRQLLAIFWLVPILIGLVYFLISARTGFALVTGASGKIYLPQSFSEAIQHIRELQDKTGLERSGMGSASPGSNPH